MNKEYDMADVGEWIGSDTSIRQALDGVQSDFVPDASFRDWPDEPERSREQVMSLEALAYCHSFLRNDLNVLVLLALGEIGTAHAYEIARFLSEKDLDERTVLDRTHVAPVLRELSACAYSGMYKASDDPLAPYIQLPNVEGLVSMAGHLYQFSKEY